MQALEENYLRSIMQLEFITKRITKKYKQLKLSKDEFAKQHPAYIELNMAFYHIVIFQARKLYEAEFRDSLSDDEWFKLKSLREEVTHAKDTNSKELLEIADVNEDLIPLFNKLSVAIHKKYNLDTNEKYQDFVKEFFEDLDKLWILI